MNNTNATFPAGLNRLGQAGLGLAVIGFLVFALAALMKIGGGTQTLMQSYLFAWLLVMTFALGCYGAMLLQGMVKAAWGYPVLRLLEAGAKTLPLMLILFIPVLLNLRSLYPWADPNLVAHDRVLMGRAGYMNPTWFTFRTLIYFLVWYVLFTLPYTRWSRLQDETGTPTESWRGNLSAPGFLIFVITVTLAFTDWLMSLDAHWYSTIFGFIMVDFMGLAAIAFVTLIVTRLARTEPYGDQEGTVVDQTVTRDLGNLLLMLTMVWGYFTLSQFLIIWSGNLPDEISYYLRRNDGTLLIIGAFRVVLCFFVPFLLLLSGRTKRTYSYLGAVAIIILLDRVVDMFWTAMPAMRHPGFALYPTDIAALIALSGVWLFAFVWLLRQSPLLPRRIEPVAEEVLHHA